MTIKATILTIPPTSKKNTKKKKNTDNSKYLPIIAQK